MAADLFGGPPLGCPSQMSCHSQGCLCLQGHRSLWPLCTSEVSVLSEGLPFTDAGQASFTWRMGAAIARATEYVGSLHGKLGPFETCHRLRSCSSVKGLQHFLGSQKRPRFY